MDLHPSQLSGIAAAAIAVALHAGANLLDSYLTDKVVPRISRLVFLTAWTHVAYLPLVVAVERPHWPSLSAAGLLLLAAIIDVSYQFPYYRALQTTDTSVVSSLFALGTLSTPILAYLTLHETLAARQYVGFALIVVPSMLLTLDPRRLRIEPSLALMFLVSLALVVQAILFKRLYAEGVGWGTVVFGLTVGDALLATAVMLARGERPIAPRAGATPRRVGALLLVNPLLTWGGEVLGLLALGAIPVSVFEGISSAQPLFVLLLSIAFARARPELLKEQLGGGHVVGRGILYASMAVGTVLVTRSE